MLQKEIIENQRSKYFCQKDLKLTGEMNYKISNNFA
jgi:hypothetical protein